MEDKIYDENEDRDIIQKLLVARDVVKPDPSILHKILVTTKTQDRYVLRGEEVGRPSFFIRLIDQYHLAMSSGMKIATGVFVLIALVGFSAFYVSAPKSQLQEVAITSGEQGTQENTTSIALKATDSAMMNAAPATGNVSDILASFDADIAAEQSSISAEEQDALLVDEEASAVSDFGQTIDENSF